MLHDGSLTFCEHTEYASVFKGIKTFLSLLTSSLHPIKLLHKGTDRIKKRRGLLLSVILVIAQPGA